MRYSEVVNNGTIPLRFRINDDVSVEVYCEDNKLEIDLVDDEEHRVSINEYLNIKLEDEVDNLKDKVIDYLINNYFYNHI